MEPIRIAQIMGKMLYGGTESVVMNYYRHIDRSKIQFDFIADSDSKMPIPRKDEIESMGGRVFIVPPYQKINEYIPALIKLFKEQNYRIVHSHLNSLNVFPMYAAKMAGVPVRISHSHSTAGKGETKKNILKYLLRPFAKLYPSHLAACSYHAGAWLFGEKTMKADKVTVFNNAIDMEKYSFNEAVRSELRSELGLDGKFVIGHIGRFCYQKNHDFLIDIFKEVYSHNPKARLLLIGDGEDRKNIESKVHKLHLNDAVLFMGNRTDVDRLYQAMDAFLFPSRYEGLGLVAVEAQIRGLRVLASTEVPSEAKISTGMEFLSLSDGPDIWAEKIIASDQETHLLSGIYEAYDIERQSAHLLEYYEELYAEK